MVDWRASGRTLQRVLCALHRRDVDFVIHLPRGACRHATGASLVRGIAWLVSCLSSGRGVVDACPSWRHPAICSLLGPHLHSVGWVGPRCPYFGMSCAGLVPDVESSSWGSRWWHLGRPTQHVESVFSFLGFACRRGPAIAVRVPDASGLPVRHCARLCLRVCGGSVCAWCPVIVAGGRQSRNLGDRDECDC